MVLSLVQFVHFFIFVRTSGPHKGKQQTNTQHIFLSEQLPPDPKLGSIATWTVLNRVKDPLTNPCRG